MFFSLQSQDILNNRWFWSFKRFDIRMVQPFEESLFRNQTHFNYILQNIEGLTPRVLAKRMKTLQMLGIVEKKTVLGSPIHIEYRLTDMGRTLEPILLAAAIYSMGFMPGVVFKDKKSRSIEEFIR
jgi:DNA-binding HxlR family transcriptional regulator